MKLGDDVERQDEVSAEREQKQLAPARNTPIPYEPRDEHDAVGDEPRGGVRVVSAPGGDEEEHERRVGDERHADGDQRPFPPLHALRCYFVRGGWYSNAPRSS